MRPIFIAPIFPEHFSPLDETSLCLNLSYNSTTCSPSFPVTPGSHRHHVITLHIGLIIIFTFVVELAKEVESHHGVQINHHGQETDGQNQLGGEREEKEMGLLYLKRFKGDSKKTGKVRLSKGRRGKGGPRQ